MLGIRIVRLAAVDIGSNTVHVLVSDIRNGSLHDLGAYSRTPALGPVVARSGRIGVAKAEEALADLQEVLDKARRLGYERLVAAATEAVRNAADREEFLARASEIAGVAFRLISGDREAKLSFAGVASRHAGRGEWLMADLGGGSLEVVAARGPAIVTSATLPAGSAVLADRHLSDPPRRDQRERLRADALRLLTGAPEADARRLVVTGGTATHLARLVSTRHPPSVLSVDALLQAEERLDSAPAMELARRYQVPAARVIAMRGGVEILLLLLDWAGLHQLHVSVEGVRHGMLLAYLERGDDWWRD
jgi:exopolyphosphatase/guanosine-5'-triphosphate,3'-diphosphate pyrophosphatase